MNEQILKKVRKIEIATRRMMNDFMTGGYKSHFKGQGVQFSEHRTYAPGDDIRHIDWKVSARSKEPLVKKYEEERELSVLIIADLSASQDFGSSKASKKEMVAELGAMIAYAASTSGDKVGVMILTDRVRKTIELKKGRNHVLRIIRDLLSFPSETGGTALKEALEEATRVLKHSGIIFILSDFESDGYEGAVRRLAKKHEVVAVKINDPSETKWTPPGALWLVDPETGREVMVDPQAYGFKKEQKEAQQKFEDKTKHIFNISGVEVLPVTTHEDYSESLVHFLKRRKQKK
jgi:uncharacterized protein (DUF58 family)